MDVRNSTGRVLSILNDSDCRSFAIPQRLPTASKQLPSLSSLAALSLRQERPTFVRQTHYSKRTSSFSSAGSARSPPLLRNDSSSSKSSSGSMDSSPSPITPAYNYNDPGFIPYDQLLRQDLAGYLPSPTAMTPFIEQQLIISPPMPESSSHFTAKAMPAMMPSQYPLLPVAPMDGQPQTLTPAPSIPASNSTSTPATSSKPSPPTASNGAPGKKNKYPCPYAASHSCAATFTTSGHAARHGKKHTGEKGVHCPICNKAFTRKDNMKQHERTHKGSISGSGSEDQPARRSKAAITKEAQKVKASTQPDGQARDMARKSSIVHSPLSEVTSLTASVIETPLNIEEPLLYQNPVPQMMIPVEQPLSSLYPPLGDDALLNGNVAFVPSFDAKQVMLPVVAPPPLMRGFSDLDTLAQAAASESYDPFYSQKFTGGM